jgi:catechol 2,3-dioxygenase-like lactoylglutathione lyase family enzyme
VATASAVGPDVGLSHVPIAVADLDRASADFERLGFALKDGRPHPNGIRNRHVKFRDGTEIELITAPQATDDLTRYYRDFLTRGDGAAFLSLYPASADRAAARMGAAGLPVQRGEIYIDFPRTSPLGYVFLAPLSHSPTDAPEHFAHRNAATSLIGVRLESASFEAERKLFTALELVERPCGDRAPLPTGSCVELSAGGRLVLATNTATPHTRITGLEVRTSSLERTASVLTGAGVSFQRISPGRISVNDHTLTHGVSLDFLGGMTD